MKKVAKIWFSSKRDRFEGLCDNSSDLLFAKNKIDLCAKINAFFDRPLEWKYDVDSQLTIGSY